MNFIKILRFFCITLTLIFSSCTSLDEMRFKRELQESLAPWIVMGKTTEDEIIERFGKPYFIVSRRESPYVFIYHRGIYFTKNSIENRKVLLTLLPPEILYSKKAVEKTVLEVYFNPESKIVSKYILKEYPKRKKVNKDFEKSEEEILREQQLRERYKDKDPPKILNRIIFEELLQ